jgi:RHS repeat-associated protein
MQPPQASAKSIENASATQQSNSSPKLPAIALPKGGGAIRGIDEKFAANPVTGTGSMSVLIATSPGRSGFGPQLSLSYDSGAGNGPFGLGWNLSLPSITRKTDKGLPQYRDADESDVFLLSGAEDLVPLLVKNGNDWEREIPPVRTVDGTGYQIERYRPRVEGLFARIERWTNASDGTDVFWRSISKDNLTTWYGRSSESRITDPTDPGRIFSWLICESYDDKGNVIAYRYKGEDSTGVDAAQVHEANRDDLGRETQRYLKRICYANRTPYFPKFEAGSSWPALPGNDQWCLELVFDYGEHDSNAPESSESHSWPVRSDPFSSYRAGFEVRTYRLCRRTLMFHHFPGEVGASTNGIAEVTGYDGLVRATEFAYDEGPLASLISGATQSGFKALADGSYLKKSLPPLEFGYTEATIEREIREIDRKSADNLPMGLDGSLYQWVDLDGEGLSGILTEQADGWFYKRNLSPINFLPGTERVQAHFAPLELIATQPGLRLGTGRTQFLDLAGDGQLDLTTFHGPTPGFYERTPDEQWDPFVSFESFPVLDWDDPNLKFVDLTGDGHADVMISEDDVFRWHPSLAEDGFGPAEITPQFQDEEKGPKLVFADGTQSIYLADFSGDGLTDLARVRNGEVCYWPNLGYGHFGGKVTMDNSPWFDLPDQFDQKRIRLADIDGSGTTDIVYLKSDRADIYRNQSGNSWSAAEALTNFPTIDNLSTVQVIDLLGNGTACLVWSSPLLGETRRPVRYVELLGGQKPHLLVQAVNNLGAETRVVYAPSTRFYLQDKLAGKPWITKLPFPVHVVERVETFDYISRNRFITRYAYHHGYFDGVEREFRGFGMVEQWDTEELAALQASGALPAPTNIDVSSYVPPVYTKTWFHTGIFLDRNHVSDFFAGLLNTGAQGEYYREPGVNVEDLLLEDTVLPFGLTAEEEREACRALKGSMLRQEIYAADGTPKQKIPYAVTEQNFTIEQTQPRSSNRHAVFFTHPRETIIYHYERNPTDPRTAHKLVLEVDAFGNVLKEAAIGYGRRSFDTALLTPDQARQGQTLITLNENSVTNAIEDDDAYRAPIAAEAQTYQLTELSLPAGQSLYSLADILGAGSAAAAIAYENRPTSGVLEKRLIEHVRTLYRSNDLSGALPLGQMGSLALPFETYKLALTPGLVTAVYGTRVTDPMLATEGGYVHSEGDLNWWIPSGRVFYSPGPTDTSAQELARATQHFFLPQRYRDPFHTNAVSTESFIAYDGFDLLIQETGDALGNRITAGERDATGVLTVSGNDYRVLQPTLIMDPNGNRTAVAVDTLGMVVGTAVMGKPPPAAAEGDTLTGFDPDLTDVAMLNQIASPFSNPQVILHRATTRLIYDPFAYQRTKNQSDPQPAVVYTLARETHDSDPVSAGGLRIQHTFSYSDGLGREIQKKIQAEPGPVPERDTDGNIILDSNGQPQMTLNDVTPRWVGSGWTIFNNKGKPVRQYEPFFTDTHQFEFDIRIGVSPVLFYDPAERVVATLHPNHTWEKVTFDPWRQATWDVNDTILAVDPALDPDVGKFFSRLPTTEYLPSWYAQRQGGLLGPDEQAAATNTAIHADTPAVAYFDSLGRTFLTVAHNKSKYSNTPATDPPIEEFYPTRVLLDIEGNQREVIDAKDRIVMRYDYGIAGPAEDQKKEGAQNRVHQASMDAGERWMLNDVTGKPVYAWDSRNQQFRTGYDPLRRPTDAFLQEGTNPEQLIGGTVYGESRANPDANNLRGKVVEVFDQAGVATTDHYDFKGNLLRNSRQVAVEYKATLDWAGPVPLEPEIYTTLTRYDALNRPTALTSPDNSVIRHTYNEANLLEAVEANLRGANASTSFVDNIDYDAKGQRVRIEYANGAETTYAYDPFTFRLTHLQTRRGTDALQDLHYTYDPTGNITHIQDDAQQTIFFRNRRVEPSSDYTYDGIYRLIEATGREHLGQIGGIPNAPTAPDPFDTFHTQLPHPGDGDAMGTYLERYVYDAVGNFLSMQHRGRNPTHPGWTRAYNYNEASLIESAETSNHLSTTVIGGGAPETLTYDARGNITQMGHLPLIRWDFQDQLRAAAHQVVNNGTPETTWCAYDAAGQRVRKVTDRQFNGGQTPTRIKENIYLGHFELYRAYGNADTLVTLKRDTLHIMHDEQRLVLLETKTDEAGLPAHLLPETLTRYQHGNHLGSAHMELDDVADVISYEEYCPYGSSSYQAVRAQIGTAKRYRYVGKERDAETGLSYHNARFYIPWLGRWLSPDPAGIGDGVCLYQYAQADPVKLRDTNGLQSTDNDDKGIPIAYDRKARKQFGLSKQSAKNFTPTWLKTLFQQEYGIGVKVVDGRLTYTGDVKTSLRVSKTAKEMWIKELTTHSQHGIEFTFGNKKVDLGDNAPLASPEAVGGSATTIDAGDFALTRPFIPTRSDTYLGVSPRAFNLARVLEHEVLGHGVERLEDAYNRSATVDNHGAFFGEGMTGNTVDFANIFSKEMGLPTRTNYYGRFGREFVQDGSKRQMYQIVFSNGGRVITTLGGDLKLKEQPDWFENLKESKWGKSHSEPMFRRKR